MVLVFSQSSQLPAQTLENSSSLSQLQTVISTFISHLVQMFTTGTNVSLFTTGRQRPDFILKDGGSDSKPNTGYKSRVWQQRGRQKVLVHPRCGYGEISLKHEPGPKSLVSQRRITSREP